MTGARIAIAAEKYLGDAEHAAVTYGDGLTDVNLQDEYQNHVSHGKIGTVMGVNIPSRFGELVLDGNTVSNFSEKPEFKESWINGGYFFFRREFFTDYLTKDENCILEHSPLIQLAKDRHLNIYKHGGFWHCMDTQRDRDKLVQLWESGKAPWVPNGKFKRYGVTVEKIKESKSV